MVSRRRFLQFGAGALAATAGCVGHESDGTPGHTDTGGRPSPTDAVDGPTTPRDDLPSWEPSWTLSFGDAAGLGLDSAGGLLYATLSRESGPSAIAAVDPDSQHVLWRTETEGEAVSGSHATAGGIARGKWGVTISEAAVYTVTGAAEEREWTALHALDRDGGDRLWSFERDRRLAVAGVSESLVVVAGLEFTPGPEQTPVSHQRPDEPLVTVVYGLDATTGDLRWQREFSGVADVAVSPDGVFVGAGDRLVGLDLQGRTTLTYDHGPATRVAAVSGRVYYLTGEPHADGRQTLHGVSPGGESDWRHDLPVAELLLDGDRLYAGGDAVVAVGPNGAVDWRHDEYGTWLLVDPDRDTLYTRSGVRADAVTAYDVAGGARWTFAPPANDAWPEAATAETLMATAITGERADEPFYTVYAVHEGEATASRGQDTLFDALGLDGTCYLTDGESNLLALE
jgi:outer membrane protein assembly factor BamB